jgi:uncharacterized protein YqhQ
MSANPEQEKQSLAFGGQALIEGVMIRSKKQAVLCVRQTNQEINIHTMEINSLAQKNRIFRLPFLRGIIMLFETMFFGIKGIIHSANVILEEEEEEFTLKEYIMVIGMVLIMNGFFIAVPFILTNYLNLNGIFFNIVESGIRLGLFILYLFIVSRWGEFTRILQYHGAEHKTINAYEARAPMNIETVSQFSRLNPHCGTSFLFITIILSIAMFTMIPEVGFRMRLLYRILLIPIIAGIGYEILKLSYQNRDNSILKIIMIPGLWLQRLTTKEPTRDMIEVAIKALENAKDIEH